MNEMKKELNLDEMEHVVGGVWRTVNTGKKGMDAALRAEPCKSSRQIGHIKNGVDVDTVTDDLIYDSVSRRNFVKVTYNGQTGYVAASILGLPR